HRRQKRMTARQQLRIRVRAEQLRGVLDRFRDLVLERCRDHALASSRARQTRSGVAGISMSWTPNGVRASTTALITAGVEAIAPVSPTPFTPSGLLGLGVTVRSTSNERSSAADGTRQFRKELVSQLPSSS